MVTDARGPRRISSRSRSHRRERTTGREESAVRDKIEGSDRIVALKTITGTSPRRNRVTVLTTKTGEITTGTEVVAVTVTEEIVEVTGTIAVVTVETIAAMIVETIVVVTVETIVEVNVETTVAVIAEETVESAPDVMTAPNKTNLHQNVAVKEKGAAEAAVKVGAMVAETCPEMPP